MTRQSVLTQDEKRWLKRLQRVLSDCPSDRLEFNTIGDPAVQVIDSTRMEEIDSLHAQGGEFSGAVLNAGAELGYLTFPGAVHATCG